jgi:hypothetical protein
MACQKLCQNSVSGWRSLEERTFCQKLTQPPSRVFGGAIDESAARFRDDILGTGPEGDLSRAAEGFVLKMFLWILIALS